jgi:hypothetical protein
MDHRTSLADTDFELMFQTNHGRESAAKNKWRSRCSLLDDNDPLMHAK